MTGIEMRKETIDYFKKMLEKRKNELVLKMPEIYIKDIQEAYSDGLKSGLRHHSHDYLVKTADLKKRYEKQKEINKELVDENEELKEKLKTAYRKGMRHIAKALKDYDRTDGAWTDYFEHTVDKVLQKEQLEFEEYGTLADQLTKAKDLLAKWVELFKPKSKTALPTPIQVETEQFLKGEFTTELPNEWHNLKKDPQDLPKTDGLYLIARANDQGPEYGTVRYWTVDQKFTGAYLFEEKPIAWLEIPAFKEEANENYKD